MVVHFPASQEEITLSTTPLRVSMRNYCDKGKGELTLHCDLVQAQDKAVSDRYHILLHQLWDSRLTTEPASACTTLKQTLILKKHYAGIIWLECSSVTDRMQMMYTEMSLHPDEFEYFQVGLGSDITFCLKELRVTGLFLEARFILSHENIACVCVSDRLMSPHV